VAVDYLADCSRIWQQPKASPPPSAAADAVDEDAAFAALLGAQLGATTEASRVRNSVGAEFQKYAAAVRVVTMGKPLKERMKLDPLAWWRSNGASYPLLAHVARSLLSVQATSAACERAFSSAGLIANHLRSSLSPDTLELCALVKSALQNGLDLRAELRALRAKAADVANKKRSATMKATLAAKKAKSASSSAAGAGAGEAPGDEVVELDAGGADAADAAFEQQVLDLLEEAEDADEEDSADL
jgi:hypothetical protein